jgi:ribonuclease D
VVTRLAADHNLPPENLVAPDSIRRLAWTPPELIDESTVAAALASTGVRRWQTGLLAAELAAALPEPPPDESSPDAPESSAPSPDAPESTVDDV